jgi:DNA-binding transcriptional LysR family regulator
MPGSRGSASPSTGHWGDKAKLASARDLRQHHRHLLDKGQARQIKTLTARGRAAEWQARPMEMHQIKYFLAVARTLNFTRAADQCNVTQPSLTRAIQKLEDEFGGLLFNRERSLTHLTELGRMVLPHLEQTHEAAEAATSLATSIGRAEVTPLVIGIAKNLASPVLDDILAALATALPGLALDLRSGTSDQLIEHALKGGMDLMLIALPDEVPERLETCPLFLQTYQMAVWAGHRLAGMGTCLAEAAPEALIDCEDDGTALWRRVVGAAGFAPEVRHRVDSRALALKLIGKGLGVAVLPSDSRAAGVEMVRIKDQPLNLTIVLGWVAGRKRGRAAEAFVRMARARDWQECATDQLALVSA